MAGKSVADNFERVRARIRAACERASRKESDVRLVAVSKGQPLSKIQEAVHAGHKLFGENYAQEAAEKQQQLSGLNWHFIGALQSNKVKLVTGNFMLIHSVDRLKLAEAISEKAAERGIVQDYLIEINVAGEASKSGLSPEELPAFLAKARAWTGARARGLMCMPPPGAAAASRPFFQQAKKLLEQWRTEAFGELSMGTSQDFEVAIEEGATIVRVGTELFGERSRK